VSRKKLDSISSQDSSRAKAKKKAAKKKKKATKKPKKKAKKAKKKLIKKVKKAKKKLAKKKKKAKKKLKKKKAAKKIAKKKKELSSSVDNLLSVSAQDARHSVLPTSRRRHHHPMLSHHHHHDPMNSRHHYHPMLSRHHHHHHHDPMNRPMNSHHHHYDHDHGVDAMTRWYKKTHHKHHAPKHPITPPTDIWAVTEGGHVFHRGGVKSQWQKVNGNIDKGIMIRQLSASTQGVWALDTKERIYFRRNIEGSWMRIAGHLRHITVSGTTVWGVNSEGMLYTRFGIEGSWQRATGHDISDVSISGYHLWGLGKDHQVMYRSSQKGGKWRKAGSIKMKQISATGGSVWGISLDNMVFHKSGVNAKWRRKQGSLKEISASGHKVYGISSGGKIFYRATKDSWKAIPGVPKDGTIALAHCDKQWVSVAVAKGTPFAQTKHEGRFLGCYKDMPAPHRDLPVNKMKEGDCRRQCYNYKFYGLQGARLCFCGNSFGHYGPSSKCSCSKGSSPMGSNCVYATSIKSVKGAKPVSEQTVSHLAIGYHASTGVDDLMRKTLGHLKHMKPSPDARQADKQVKGLLGKDLPANLRKVAEEAATTAAKVTMHDIVKRHFSQHHIDGIVSHHKHSLRNELKNLGLHGDVLKSLPKSHPKSHHPRKHGSSGRELIDKIAYHKSLLAHHKDQALKHALHKRLKHLRHHRTKAKSFRLRMHRRLMHALAHHSLNHADRKALQAAVHRVLHRTTRTYHAHHYHHRRRRHHLQARRRRHHLHARHRRHHLHARRRRHHLHARRRRHRVTTHIHLRRRRHHLHARRPRHHLHARRRRHRVMTHIHLRRRRHHLHARRPRHHLHARRRRHRVMTHIHLRRRRHAAHGLKHAVMYAARQALAGEDQNEQHDHSESQETDRSTASSGIELKNRFPSDALHVSLEANRLHEHSSQVPAGKPTAQTLERKILRDKF